MGRSGTTLIKEVLNTAINVVVYSEPRHACLQATLSLLEEVRYLYRERSAAWRKIDDERAEQNVSYILRHTLCGISGATDPEGRMVKPRFGFKQPNAELYFERYEAALGSLAPWYLYCWREPIDIYDSYLSMPWGNTKPRPFRKKLESSFDAALHILKKASERTVLVPVHRLSSDQEYRTRFFSEIFDRFGLEASARTEQFLSDWPPINTRDKVSAQPSIEAAVKRQRLRNFEKTLKGSTIVARFREVAIRSAARY